MSAWSRPPQTARSPPDPASSSSGGAETTITTKHLGEGIAADYDAEGRLAGIEILDALKRLGDPGALRQVILEGVGPGRD